jgi:hypothetical protein
VQINCEAEELSQATQLPPTASCLKSLSPAVSFIQTPRLRNSTCPAHRNLLHFTSVTSFDLILLCIIQPSYMPTPSSKCQQAEAKDLFLCLEINLCSLVDIHRRFAATYWLYIQDVRRPKQVTKPSPPIEVTKSCAVSLGPTVLRYSYVSCCFDITIGLNLAECRWL